MRKLVEDFALVVASAMDRDREEHRFESPLESKLFYALEKHIAQKVKLETQVEIKARGRKYRIDLVLKRYGRMIGVECDGRDFHKEDRDGARDIDILVFGAPRIERIYRILGKHIWREHHFDRLLYLMSRVERDMFSERSMVNLRILGEANMRSISHVSGSITAHYNPNPENYCCASLDDSPDREGPVGFVVGVTWREP